MNWKILGLGYGISVLVAWPITYWWSAWLHDRVGRHKLKPEDPEQEPTLRIPWIPTTIGIFERILFATLVGWNVPGAAGFIGSWITIKALGGWASWSKGTTYGRAVFGVGLLGSCLSAIFGVAGGLVIHAYR